MRNGRDRNGFTLIELLLALVVTGIVTAAVATLAFAMNSANDESDDTSQKQAYIRFATLKISDLVRYSRLVCYASPDEIAVWAADKNNDEKINIDEVVYIECGPAKDHLYLYEFNSSNSTAINPSQIVALSTNWWSAYAALGNPMKLVPQCSNVQFIVDKQNVLPELLDSRLVNILFDITENGFVRQCQISAALRGPAANLLDASGDIVSDDD